MNTKQIIDNRAVFSSLCAVSGASNFTFNIGLLASKNLPIDDTCRVMTTNNTVQALKIPQIVSEVITDLENIGYSINDYGMAQSETEPTLVIKASHKNAKITYSDLLKLSSRYDQDCIAISDGKKGVLIGKLNYLWGEFNSEFFIDEVA